MIRRARSSVFWPGMASDIRQLADSREACQEMKPKNQHEPLKQHKEGNEPWQKIGLDIFQIADKYYLVTVDYYSTFIEVDLLSTQTSTRVINLLKSHFARYGIPRMIVSDGGPQFSSSEFDLFAKAWHIIHVTSSPMHQQANGKAEAAVKSMKKLLIKTHEEGSDPLEALLEHRNTPRQDVGLSPAEIMFKRKTRSLVPSFNKHSSNDPIEARREVRKDTVKKSHDRKAKSLPELYVGQHIFFQHLEGRDWKFGEISNILGPSTDEVKRPDGSTYRRNRVHPRPTQVNLKTRDTSPSHVPHSSNRTAPKEQMASTKPLPEEVANNSDNNASNPQNAQPNSLAVNRPRRSINPPVRFNDYIMK